MRKRRTDIDHRKGWQQRKTTVQQSSKKGEKKLENFQCRKVFPILASKVHMPVALEMVPNTDGEGGQVVSLVTL